MLIAMFKLMRVLVELYCLFKSAQLLSVSIMTMSVWEILINNTALLMFFSQFMFFLRENEINLNACISHSQSLFLGIRDFSKSRRGLQLYQSYILPKEAVVSIMPVLWRRRSS